MSNFDNISGAMDSGSLLSIRLEIGRREVKMRHFKGKFLNIFLFKVIPTTDLPNFKKLLH